MKTKTNNWSLTADTVVISYLGGAPYILLIKRKNDPFKECWALPGGFIEPDETFEAAALRELQEETAISPDEINTASQVRVYGDPGRDPRGRVVSIVFHVYAKPGLPKVQGQDDAADAKWWPVKRISELDLAFDHLDMINDVLNRHTDSEERKALRKEIKELQGEIWTQN